MHPIREHPLPETPGIEQALAELLVRQPRLVLAVSGGGDSMALLAAADAVRRPSHHVVVATFDHGTGAFARRATALVRREARRRGLVVTSGRRSTSTRGGTARAVRHDEASWRSARWAFLGEVAAAHGAIVATAHSREDHLETVVMRVLRGAGVRGLAALLAESPVARPLLPFTRDQLRTYARAQGVPWLDDPSNDDRRHLRNRVRLDILPALTRARPTLPDELLELSREAAAVRTLIDAVAHAWIERVASGEVTVGLAALASLPPPARPLAWQSLAAVAGVVLDWRGTMRLADFGARGGSGGWIPLSGGFEAVGARGRLTIRRRVTPQGGEVPLAVDAVTPFGAWHFSPFPRTTINECEAGDPWEAWLPADRTLTVRAWRDGDRIAASSPTGERRVKRFFADRGIPAREREGWPIVLDAGRILWIPGVCRSSAAAVRSGRPVVHIRCERLPR